MLRYLLPCLLLISTPLLAQEDSADHFKDQEEPMTLKESLQEIREEEPNFGSWLWEKQMRPTLEHATDRTSLMIFFSTALGTSIAHQSDKAYANHYGSNRGMSHSQARPGSILGSGFPALALASTQLFLDTENGLQHFRAIGFTSLTHISIAASSQRRRPNGKKLSFPSGHTSSSFATATSLTYSYGPIIGVPALALATYIGFSRIANNSHWLSDVVAGAGLGIYWARASAQVGLTKDNKSQAMWYPIYQPSEYGAQVGVGFEKNL